MRTTIWNFPRYSQQSKESKLAEKKVIHRSRLVCMGKTVPFVLSATLIFRPSSILTKDHKDPQPLPW